MTAWAQCESLSPDKHTFTHKRKLMHDRGDAEQPMPYICASENEYTVKVVMYNQYMTSTTLMHYTCDAEELVDFTGETRLVNYTGGSK